MLGNLLAGKGAIRSGEGARAASRGRGTIRAGQNPLTNFEIQKYYQKEPKFNDVYSKNNLPKIKDGTYLINLDEYESIITHWIALHGNANNTVYFDRFELEHIPKEIKTFIGGKNIITNI